MNTTTAVVIIIAIFAVVIIVAFLRFRKSGNAEMKGGPFGTELKIKGEDKASAKSRPGIKADGITSRDGGVMAEDTTGNGIDIKNVDARDDVLLSSNVTRQGDGPKQAFSPKEIGGIWENNSADAYSRARHQHLTNDQQ